MLPLRYARRWQVAGIAVLALVFAGTLAPALWFLDSVPEPRYFALDKWLHATIFAFLTVWFCGQYARAAYWRVAAAMFAFGVVIEICQRFLTAHRSAEIMDLVADSVGILAGLAIARAGVGGWSLRFEEWLQARQ